MPAFQVEFLDALYNGSVFPQGQNRQTINLAQSGLEMGFLLLAGSGPKAGPKWVSGPFSSPKIGPEIHFRPTFGPLPANDGKPISDPF